jgi:hypothetical protein
MSNSRSRRTFIGAGAAISAGIALGAFTKASLAKQPRTMTQNAFLQRSDRRLDDTQTRLLLAGNSMIGVTHKGAEYVAYLAKDGSVDKLIGNRRETGRWKIRDGMLFMKFPTLANGKEFGLKLYKYRLTALYKGYSPNESRWTWFVTEPGKAKELA